MRTMSTVKRPARKRRDYMQGRHNRTNTGVSLIKLNRHTGHSDYSPRHSEYTLCPTHGSEYVIGICCPTDTLKRIYSNWVQRFGNGKLYPSNWDA